MKETNVKITTMKTTVMDVPSDELKETALGLISSMQESGNNIAELVITGGEQEGTMKIITKEKIQRFCLLGKPLKADS